MQASLPLYRHPSITMLIEGDDNHAEPLWAQLDPAVLAQSVNGQVPAQAAIAIAFDQLREQGCPISTAPRRDEFLNLLVDDCLSSIYSYVASPKRFCAPTVVIIDYESASSGMVACEEVSSVPGKKIWFTSSSNALAGINAFNHDWIDQFICSDVVGAINQVQETIVSLQAQYFRDRSRELAASVDMGGYGFLVDPDFQQLVEDIMDKYGFVEYYLFREPGGLLFFDADANPMLMSVHTEEGMARQFELARKLDASPDILQDIFECRIMPFCLEAMMEMARAPGALERGCRPVSICRGKVEYFWALFDLPPEFRKAEPFSHAQFMRSYNAVA